MTDLPDARDGLTRLERIILWQLHEAQMASERGRAPTRGRERANYDERESVPTAMLYGRVVEHIDVSIEEFQRALQKLGCLSR